MQTWKTRFRRIAAMVCALALCASLLPAGALAEPENQSTEEVSTQNVEPVQEAARSGPDTTDSEAGNEYITVYYGGSITSVDAQSITVKVQNEAGVSLADDLSINDITILNTMRISLNESKYASYKIVSVTAQENCEIIDLPGSLNDDQNKTFTFRARNNGVLVVTLQEVQNENVIELKDKDGKTFGTISYDSSEYPAGQAEQNTTVYIYLNDKFVMTVEDLQIPNTEAGTGTKNFVLALHDGYSFKPVTEGVTTSVLDHSTIDGQTIFWHKDTRDDRYSYLTFGNITSEGDNYIVLHFYGNNSGETQDPTAPTVDEIKNLIGEDGIETYCTTQVENHGSVCTGLLGEEGTDYEINYTEGETTATVEIQPTIYATNMDQHTGTNSHVTVVEGSDHIIELAYVEGAWTLVGEKPAARIHVTCDGSVTPPTDPELPGDEDLKDLLNGKISIICTTNTEHDAITSGLLGDRDTDYTVTQNGNTATVTIKADKYVAAMDDRYSGSEHEFVEAGSDMSIGLTYDATNGWTVDADDTATIKVKCDAGTTPGTEEPEKPTPDDVDKLDIKNAVTLDCINTSVNHADVTYDLKSGSYTIGEVVNGGNDLYYVSLTVRPDAYVRDYDKATGSTHTWPGNDYGIINLYWNNDTQAWETRGDYGVKFLVKCSTVTVPGDGGNNNDTPKDEHPDIAEGIANGTWGGTPTPTPAASATSTIPQTSDSMPIGLLAGTAAIAAAAIALLLVLRKRRQQ